MQIKKFIKALQIYTIFPVYIYRDGQLLNSVNRKIDLINKKISELKIESHNNKSVYCPVCNNSFEKFKPIDGMTFRDNAMCPKCSSRERHRLLALFFQKFWFLSFEFKQVLHIAPDRCFYGLYSKIKEKIDFEYNCIDLFPELYGHIEQMMKMNVMDLKYPANYFSFIHCAEVLEHVDNDIKAMKELFRCLKPDGKLILTVPIKSDEGECFENSEIVDPEDRRKHFGQEDHVRFYTTFSFKERLMRVGFMVKVVRAGDFMEEKDIRKSKILMGDRIFICTKRN